MMMMMMMMMMWYCQFDVSPVNYSDSDDREKKFAYFCDKNLCCVCSLELPRQGVSNKQPVQSQKQARSLKFGI